MIYYSWAAEFLLECAGCALYFKRNRLLSVLLAFCAVGDATTCLIYQSARQTLYANCYWAARVGKYFLLIWLACAICGMFVAERRKSFATISAAFLSLGSAAIITAVSASGDTLKDRLLDGEIAANMLLLGMVFLGWLGRRDRLDQTWKWIAAGFMVMVGSDLIFTALWTFWDGAKHFYPLGAISAQAIWIIGPLRRVRLGELRLSLEKKFPAVEEMRVM